MRLWMRKMMMMAVKENEVRRRLRGTKEEKEDER